MNAFWELEAEQVTAEPRDDGSWQVVLNVRARKTVVDESGVETEVPMNDSVEIGVFDDKGLNEPIYLQKHAIGVDTSWQGSVLLRDIADVKRLRDEDGPNLVTQGSTELVHALLANDLVDAMTIFTIPVVLGGGKKLFADGSAPHAYKLTRSRVSSTGLMIGHYERDGEIKIGGTELDSPSEREIARQARMKREG